MSQWREVELGRLIHVKHGYAFKGQFFAHKGSDLVLTPGNFAVGGGLQIRPGREKYYTGKFPTEFRLQPGDLLVVMTDLKQDAPILGSPAWVPDEGSYLHNQRLGLVTVTRPDVLDGRFLYWLLVDDGTRAQLRATATGATVRHTAPERIYRVRATLPSLATQRRIAAVLSSIDDLIENNRRRIALLEQMAQAIYREWFVHFRYPAHDDDEFVDSPLGPIPRGWSAPEMQKVCEVVDCLHSKKPVEDEHGCGVLLQLFNISEGGRLDLSKKFMISEDDYRLWTSRIEVREGDCVVTNVGRVGAVAQVPAGAKAAIGRNMTAVRAREGLMTPTFLLEYFFSPHMQAELARKTDIGTIMDALNVKGIVRLAIPLPPNHLLQAFERATRPVRRLVEVLGVEADILRKTRDVLLPKLVAGAIDVSELDLDALLEESAA